MRQNDRLTNKTSHFRIRVYSKTELGRKYKTPDVTDRAARMFLHDCIRHNKELHRRLRDVGYNERCHNLTPLQVRIIVEVIGEP